MTGLGGVRAGVGVRRRNPSGELPVCLTRLVLHVRGDLPADLGGGFDDLPPRLCLAPRGSRVPSPPLFSCSSAPCELTSTVC